MLKRPIKLRVTENMIKITEEVFARMYIYNV